MVDHTNTETFEDSLFSHLDGISNLKNTVYCRYCTVCKIATQQQKSKARESITSSRGMGASQSSNDSCCCSGSRAEDKFGRSTKPPPSSDPVGRQYLLIDNDDDHHHHDTTKPAGVTNKKRADQQRSRISEAIRTHHERWTGEMRSSTKKDGHYRDASSSSRKNHGSDGSRVLSSIVLRHQPNDDFVEEDDWDGTLDGDRSRKTWSDEKCNGRRQQWSSSSSPVRSTQRPAALASVGFTPDGRSVVSVSSDTSIRSWVNSSSSSLSFFVSSSFEQRFNHSYFLFLIEMNTLNLVDTDSCSFALPFFTIFFLPMLHLHSIFFLFLQGSDGRCVRNLTLEYFTMTSTSNGEGRVGSDTTSGGGRTGGTSPVDRPLPAAAAARRSLGFTPDKKRLCTSSLLDHTLALHDTETGERTTICEGHSGCKFSNL